MRPEVIIIVAVTNDWAIGKEGDLLYHISADLRRFKSLTLGQTVVMGRKTFESLPKGALPGRANIVVTRNSGYAPTGALTAHSIEDAIDNCLTDKCFIIGGAEIYRSALPLADRLELTVINARRPDADCFFNPGLDSGRWSITNQTPATFDEDAGVCYSFISAEATSSCDIAEAPVQGTC